MATIILSILIFGAAALIIYQTYLKPDRKGSCDACDCPAKPKKS